MVEQLAAATLEEEDAARALHGLKLLHLGLQRA